MSDTFVLLHGFTGGPASFDALGTLLPPTARILRPWLAGHGPAPATSWSSELERLVGLLEAEGIEGAHLVGYSMGGRIGLGLLAAAPERFARATLVGAHPGLATEAARRARRAEDARWVALLERAGLEAFLDAWSALPLWASQASLSTETRDAQERVRREHRAAGLAASLRALGLAEMPPVDPTGILTPVTLVVGELDAAHRAHSGALARALPRARLHVVPDAGHNVLLERPDALAALVLGDPP